MGPHSEQILFLLHDYMAIYSTFCGHFIRYNAIQFNSSPINSTVKKSTMFRFLDIL